MLEDFISKLKFDYNVNTDVKETVVKSVDMEKNIFKGAKFGDKFVCRNGTIAYYCRYVEGDDKGHFLMTNDVENDFVSVYDDGHAFHLDKENYIITEGKHKGKTVCELYGWKEEELRNNKLDIVSKYQEPVNDMLQHQKRLDIEKAWNILSGIIEHSYGCSLTKEEFIQMMEE